MSLSLKPDRFSLCYAIKPHVFGLTLLRKRWMWVYLTAKTLCCDVVLFSCGEIASYLYVEVYERIWLILYTVVTLTWWCLGNGRNLPCSSWSRPSENTMWQNPIPSKFSTKLRYVFFPSTVDLTFYKLSLTVSYAEVVAFFVTFGGFNYFIFISLNFEGTNHQTDRSGDRGESGHQFQRGDGHQSC